MPFLCAVWHVVGPLPGTLGSLLIETNRGRVTFCHAYGQRERHERVSLGDTLQINRAMGSGRSSTKRPACFQLFSMEKKPLLPDFALLVDHAFFRRNWDVSGFSMDLAFQPPHLANRHDSNGSTSRDERLRVTIAVRNLTVQEQEPT